MRMLAQAARAQARARAPAPLSRPQPLPLARSYATLPPATRASKQPQPGNPLVNKLLFGVGAVVTLAVVFAAPHDREGPHDETAVRRLLPPTGPLLPLAPSSSCPRPPTDPAPPAH